ncbi:MULTISPECIES: nucleotide disphospho-sugar-binding domain-containing protein [unclassified Micromonospora]|uniref:nucleotide disphospho-sugar-binding domain-containing protein n=1 Tax=unclassified Micromonospora TaxID=2617518 RepID=UPI00362E6A8A
MRVLMMVTPVPSHFQPLVPLAWALRAAGHDVLVVAQPDVLPLVESTGLSALAVGDPFHVDDLLFETLPADTRPLAVRPRLAPHLLGHYGRLWATHARYLLPAYLPVARELRPDLIVADPLEYSSLVIGAVLGVPVVHHRWGVDEISGPARAAVRPVLAGVCERLGIAGLPDPTVLVDPCPPSLQLPGAEPAMPMRYVPYNGRRVLPPWRQEEVATRSTRSPGNRRVAVTMGGTLAVNGVPFVRRVLSAFAGMPQVSVLATVEEKYRAELGGVPENVQLIDNTPLDLFLGSCAAVVHQGGAGTTMTATAFGLPQLVLPQLADHFGHGDRIAATGAGIAFHTVDEQDDVGLLRESLAALLFESAYREAATELRAEMRRTPAPDTVVAELTAGHSGRTD